LHRPQWLHTTLSVVEAMRETFLLSLDDLLAVIHDGEYPAWV